MDNFKDKCILVFASHNQAAFLYTKLIREGFKVELISTPCRISSGCSQSIKFREELMETVLLEAEKAGIKIVGAYKIIGENGNLEYIKIK